MVSFNTTEQSILNVFLLEESKTFVLTSIAFNIEISEDENVVAELKSLHEKISSLSDSEWEKVKVQLPFDIPYSLDENNVDVLA